MQKLYKDLTRRESSSARREPVLSGTLALQCELFLRSDATTMEVGFVFLFETMYLKANCHIALEQVFRSKIIDF